MKPAGTGEHTRTALSVSEASANVVADIKPLGTECVPLRRALGRVLAHEVRSPVSLPPWDNSSMDGYAVRADDVRNASDATPVVLPVLETVAAGGAASQPVRPGSAIRIMTGAPLPQGADSVIRVEDTDGGSDRVSIRDGRDALRNVRPMGEDLRAGDVALAAGTTLGAAQLGVLASVGAGLVDVHRIPRVAVLATGDELVDVDGFEAVRQGKRIVSSNSYTLVAAVTEAGGEAVDLGIAPDDRAVLRERFERARAEQCDMLVTSGGVSVGEFDFTREVLLALGADMKFWRVRMRPGAPVGFGVLHGAPWVGLPGNPVSSMVTFELFVRPAIRRMRGEQRLFRRATPVTMEEEVSIAAPLTHFIRGIVASDGRGHLRARLTGPQGSGLLTSMARANALLVVPPERYTTGPVRAGETVMALLLGSDALLSAHFET